jgi:hypothetical protein
LTFAATQNPAKPFLLEGAGDADLHLIMPIKLP